MRAFALCVVALGLAVSPAMAGAGGPADSASSGSANSTATDSSSRSAAAKPAEPSSLQLESEVQQLRDLIEAQSTQIQAQSDQLKAAEDQMRKLQEQLSATANTNVAALAASANTGANAVAANVAASPAPIGPSLSVPASTSPAPSNGGQETPNGPASLTYKGITLTPGGFMAAETVWHQKALGADINTPSFGSTAPFDGASQAHISEFSASGRQSRISMLAEGKLSNVKIGGYYEMDFLSAGTTSNPNQSNSYTMRQRQFWGQAAFTNGITFTGGQQWSLITETTHGMDNRTENLPMTIDAQYQAGFSWARQYGFRVTKNFSNKFWLGASIEEAQATLTVHGNPTANSGGSTVCVTAACTGTTGTTVVNPTVLNNFLLGTFGTSGGLDNPLGNYAYNLAPDFVVKAVWEPGFGHYEVFGVLASFHDRVFPCVPITGTTPPPGCTSITSAAGAINDAREGGGGGANARWALLAKKVDFGLHFFGGDGIGRYGSSGLSDATVRPDGTMALLRNYQALGTLQFHPTPKLDVYFNVGGEFTNRAQYIKSGSTPNEGYGALGFSNAGCWTETDPVTGPSTSSNTGVPTGVGGSTGFVPGPLANCTGDIRRVVEGTVGFWYRFYSGPKGRVQFGMQYSSYVRQAFSGVGAPTTAAIGTSGEPKSNENMVFTSFRYYLP
jgi:hypothetical protein